MGTETVQAVAPSVPRTRHGRLVVDWLTTTDHKKIGHLYLITSFLFFLVGGVMALLMRAELARPGEFGAHQQRHDPADQEEQERRDQVEMTDLLVIGGGQPVHDQPPV